MHVVKNGVPICENVVAKPAPKDIWTIGTMALYRPRKGIEVLLEALSILKQQKCPIHLRAVGGFETPQYESEVMNLANQLDVADCITWTGFQRDINAQLLPRQNSDLMNYTHCF